MNIDFNEGIPWQFRKNERAWEMNKKWNKYNENNGFSNSIGLIKYFAMMRLKTKI